MSPFLGVQPAGTSGQFGSSSHPGDADPDNRVDLAGRLCLPTPWTSKARNTPMGRALPARRPRSAVPSGLFGMLLAVWCVEAGNARHELRWKTMLPWDWETTGRAASREATRAEVLCFGDS